MILIFFVIYSKNRNFSKILIKTKAMNLKIKGDLLEGDKVKFVKTPNHSGAFTPDTIVLHYTGGPTLISAQRTLTSPRVSASAHLIIGRDGEIVQLAPFNIVTWHAGRSSYAGRSGYN